MPLHPTWQEIAVRLLLTLLAGASIGLDRGISGQAAGLRTVILVCLAASVAMIQANVLLSVGGKTSGSFGVMDLMRLPLGILTGVGFIGGGAIFRRGDLVAGVTTAATLWVVTVIGLCLGGGQIGLGVSATILSVITLWGVKWLEMRIPREQHATLVIASATGSSASELADTFTQLGCRGQFRRQSEGHANGEIKQSFDISWKRSDVAGPPIEMLKLLNERYRVISFQLTSESRHQS
jgi:putative Mg2+ transporter-C (MgtC) family protein